MDKFFKNPRIQAALGLVVVILLGWWLAKSPAQEEPKKQEAQTEQKTEEPPKNQVGQPAVISSPNSWEGMLKAADDPNKGNLMLLTTDKKIYIRTSRDFSQLVDKVVFVTYEGTAEAFRLGDIVEKAAQETSEAGN